MFHSDFSGAWLCGPGSLFSGFHFGGLLHLLAWGLGLFLLYKLIRALGSSRQDTTTAGSSESLGILERRYASGEIDQEEFLRRKKDLGG